MSIHSRLQAISKDEFLRMFRKCIPPQVGWSRRIGIANSGGPDSTCLLFLIHRYLSDQANSNSQALPQSVISLTIDHDLQTSSSAMAEHCSKTAQFIGVEHRTFKIPWSDLPYPPRPTSGQAFENIARTARYHLLFQAMAQEDVGVLAFGHHSDDQVETSLMRLGRGTTEIGAGGMRPRRRWGMGMGKDEGSLGWAGYEGMNRWIVRPLLDVNKDRILTTCEANGLEYITDNTNFQPHITLRNALRRRIQSRGVNGDTDTSQEPMPIDITEKLTAIEQAVSSLDSLSVTLDSGAHQLRSAVGVLTANVEDVDSQVDSILKRCSLSSFPGTYLVSSRGILSIHDEALRRAIVLRIMRYVSFHPWGSIRADGNRRMASIKQITDKLWSPNPFHPKISMFVAGGGVLWTPVVVKGSRIKTPDRVFASGIKQSDETFGWLASRQPPLSRHKMKERGIANTLELDITKKLVDALCQKNGAPPTLRILYDCRFLVEFNLEKMPQDLAARLLSPSCDEKIVIYPSTRWYWPKIMREIHRKTEILHSKINEKSVTLPFLEKEADDCDTSYWRPNDPRISSEWINIMWIRSLDAI